MSTNDKRSLACTTCAKAKSRCIPGPGPDDKCERCHRLNKSCLSRAPAPPRPKNHVKRSRVAELEKRLSELECAQSVSSGDNRSPSAPEEGPVPGPSVMPERRKGPPRAEMSFEHLFPSEEGTSAWPSKESVASLRPWDSLWPSMDEAEKMVMDYRQKLAHLFPFVMVPEMSAAELRETHPFLWKGIMIAECYLDGARQERVGEELLSEITRVSMVNGVKSMDLLQGLQLLIAWFHHALKSTRLTNLLFLARSLSLALGLNKNEPTPEEAFTMNLDPLRLYTGTYYLNTLVFTTNKRTEVLMNTSNLDRCCNILESAKQYKSDEFLVKLVKVQQLAQSISLTLAQEQGQQMMQLPLTIVVQSFQDQLNTFRQSLPPELAENPMLEAHIAIAGVILTEFAISDRTCNPSNITLTDRLRFLWSCVRSLQAIFQRRFNRAEDLDNPIFVCLHGSDVSYALITSLRLVTLRLPGWNVDQIIAELDFYHVMDRLIIHLQGLVDRRASGTFSVAFSWNSDPIEGLLKLCAGLREHARAEMAKAVAESSLGSAMDTTTGAVPPPAQVFGGDEMILDGFWKDFMDDAFWNNGDFYYADFQ